MNTKHTLTYTFKGETFTSQHKTKELAEKMGRRLEKMSKGKITWKVTSP